MGITGGGIFYSEYGNSPEIETPAGYVYEFNGLVDGKTELDLYGIENSSDIIAPVSTNISIPKTALFELIFVNGGSTGNLSRGTVYSGRKYGVNGASGSVFVGKIKLKAGTYPLKLAGNVLYTKPTNIETTSVGKSGQSSSFAGITLTASKFGQVVVGDSRYGLSTSTRATGGTVQINDESIIIEEIIKADGVSGDYPTSNTSSSLRAYCALEEFYDKYGIRYRGAGSSCYINYNYLKSGPGYFKLTHIENL